MNDFNIETKIKLDRFKPRDYQKSLCDAFENKGYKKLIAIWPRRCLSGQSHITMADGSFKLLRDIKPGDEILAWNGNSFETDKVKHFWSTGIKNTKIVKSSGLSITSSEDHVFAALCSSTDLVKWLPLKEIKTGMQLLQYAGVANGEVRNPDLAEFWGFMLSDGYVSYHQQPKFTHANDAILKRVAELALKLFNVKAIWRPKGNSYDLGLTNGTKGGSGNTNPIKELFRNERLDIPKSIQRLPKALWQFDEDSILSFFSALIAAAGTIHISSGESAEITFNFGQSYTYAWDVYWLLRKVGITPHAPNKGKGSNWQIKIDRQVFVKKLLSKKIYGKEDEQSHVMPTLDQCPKELGIFAGCYKASFSTANADPEELFDIETEKNHNFIANGLVVHNSGKDIVAFNLMVRAALAKIGVYYYILPTYSQGRKIIFDSISNSGQKFVDFIPPELVAGTNSHEMKIKLVNGSLIQVVGSDSVDSLVGTNPMGVIFSEYALQDPTAYQFIRPILAANDGWALFVSTPRGKNTFWEMFQIATNSPEWFVSKLTLDDTNHIPLSEIEKDRQEGLMSDDLIMQEYYTSFTMGVEGAYYAKYLDRMRLSGQIGTIQWEPAFKVNTAWDLGVRDSTTIIFFQIVGQTVRIIDCYEKTKEGLEHYAKILAEKPYQYGKHFAPHDIAVRELGTGMTRIEKAKQLGINFTVAPNIGIEDGIEAVRSAFAKIWIDDTKCLPLIKALENYRQEYDARKKIYNSRPLHDWSSHFSDAARYLAVSLSKLRDGATPEDIERRYREARYGGNSNLPGIFGDRGQGFY